MAWFPFEHGWAGVAKRDPACINYVMIVGRKKKSVREVRNYDESLPR